jgi:hypothetical protein
MRTYEDNFSGDKIYPGKVSPDPRACGAWICPVDPIVQIVTNQSKALCPLPDTYQSIQC